MTTANHPSKTLVRKYLARRSNAATPPPTLEEVRRQLGWALVAADTKPPGAPRS